MAKPELQTYQKLCTEFYDLELESRPDAAQILAFYMTYAVQAHGKILEPMCGSGRFLIPMLMAGWDVEGFDASEHMLEALKKKYAAISKSAPPVWQQFIQNFSSDKKYRLIFIPFGSLGLVTNQQEVKKALSAFYQHLASGGKLVLEIETVASLPEPLNEWRRGVRMRSDGSKIVLHMLPSYDQGNQIFTSLCRYESIRNGVAEATEVEEFRQYLYRFDEIDLLLREVGFNDVKKYSDYRKKPALDEKSMVFVYECTKL